MKNNQIQNILNLFPKQRPPLPRKIKKIFNKIYKENRINYIISFAERWMHKSIHELNSIKKTLEIGAGTLNHFEFEKINNNYDIIEPKKYLYKNSIQKKKIRKILPNLKACKKQYYDRIISIAVLEHMTELPKFLAESSFYIKNNGYHSHSVPCEGHLFNFASSIVSGIPFYLKHRISYRYIMKHEHVNNFDEIISLIKFFYKKVKIKYSYPFYTKYLSFYANITFKHPNKERVKKFMKNKKFKLH